MYNHLETNKMIINNAICLLVCINTVCIHFIYYPGCILNMIFMINELVDKLSIISRWLYTVSTWKSKLKSATPRNTCRNLSFWILLCILKKHLVAVWALFISVKYVKLIYSNVYMSEVIHLEEEQVTWTTSLHLCLCLILVAFLSCKNS